MALQVKMRGDLQATTIPGEFKEVITAIELVKARGQEFLIMDKDDGNKIGFFMNNLNSVEEIDDAY